LTDSIPDFLIAASAKPESAPGAGDGGSILLKDELEWWFNRGVERIAFDDGTVWTPDDLRPMVLAQASASNAATIIGFPA
jgi:hypothetical protein